MRSGSGASAPRERVPLSPFGTLGVGGLARWFVPAEDANDVAAAHRWCEEQGVPWFVLGGGSNVVIADEGFDGLVLQIAIHGVSITQKSGDTIVKAGAGEEWDALVEAVVALGLSNVECTYGIPGKTQRIYLYDRNQFQKNMQSK